MNADSEVETFNAKRSCRKWSERSCSFEMRSGRRKL
jgi:hypothetical protein